MYKPPKREDPSSALKVKLPLSTGMPPMSVVKGQLDECQQKKGMQIEQAWTTSKPGQKFVLIAQLQEGSKQPVWTLYEENDTGSKMHWSQPFDPNDYTMMYDVVCMSAPDPGASVGIPDQLKPGNEPKKAGPQPARSATGLPATAPAMGGSAYPSPAAAVGYPSPAAGGYPSPAGASGFPAPAAGSGYPAPAAPPVYPAQAPAAPPPAPPANYPPPGGYQQQQPQYAAPQPPAPYPPGYQPYPGAQQPQQAPYQQPYPGNAQPWQQGYAAPQQPYPGQAPMNSMGGAGSTYAPSASYASQFDQTVGGSAMVDYGLLSHNANILLGELMFEAGLITEPTLEAALKIQEFVREERMSPTQACEILKKHHGLGASIDNYLSPEDFDIESGNAKAPKKSSTSKAAGSTAVKPSGATGAAGAKPAVKGSGQPELPKAEKIKLQLASFDLLQKAGLLKNDDLQTAHAVYKKHGGDIVQMLTAAGKMDATTYKAAEACIPLIHDNKMKVEQCIIALNYCQRSRVDFDSALDELGWENPRKS